MSKVRLKCDEAVGSGRGLARDLFSRENISTDWRHGNTAHDGHDGHFPLYL